MGKEKVSIESALKIIGMIRTFFKEEGLGVVGHVELHVHSDEDMIFQFGSGVEGNACSAHEINMLREIQPSKFAEIFAHELFHIYHFEKGIFGNSAEIEGAANLAAYLFLQRVGTPGCRRCMNDLLTNPDPVYGDGFRRMLDVYNKFGWEGCFRILETTE